MVRIPTPSRSAIALFDSPRPRPARLAPRRVRAGTSTDPRVREYVLRRTRRPAGGRCRLPVRLATEAGSAGRPRPPRRSPPPRTTGAPSARRIQDRLERGAVVVGEGGRGPRTSRGTGARRSRTTPRADRAHPRVRTEAQRFVGHEPGGEAIAGRPTLFRRVLEDAHGRRGLTGHRRSPAATAGHLVVEHAHCGVDLGEPGQLRRARHSPRRAARQFALGDRGTTANTPAGS